MKPALSPTTTGCLPSREGERLDVLEDLVLGDDGADHLDELQDRRRVEEVHADDALGVPVATAISVTDSEDVLVARIASGRRPRRAWRRLLLEVEVLGHGLDRRAGSRPRRPCWR